MAVVLNARGTSISSFQIGKQGPIIKNNAGSLEFRNSSDSGFVNISANNSGIVDVVDDVTPQLGGPLDVNGQSIGNGTEELIKFSETGSAVNELTIINAATGNNPTIQASGDDSAVGLDIRSKGIDPINFETASGSNRQVQIKNTSSAVNYITLTGSGTGNAVSIGTAGTDTNIDLELAPKGSGDVILGDTATNTQIAAPDNASGNGYTLAVLGGSSTGSGGDGGDVLISAGAENGAGTEGSVYIADSSDQSIVCFKGSTGANVNYLEVTSAATANSPIIAAVGSDTNIDIVLNPKGSGDVILGATIAAANSLQAENDQDFVVKGGDSGGSAAAGDMVIEGGDGSGAFAPGNIVIRGGVNGTGTSYIDLDSGVVVGGATGGDQGAGTVNASNYYIDGVVGLTTSLKSLTTKTAAYTTVLADDVVLSDTTSTAFTITLGTAAVSAGKQQTIKDSGGNANTNNITIETEASETIDGASSSSIATNYGSLTVISDGTHWFII